MAAVLASLSTRRQCHFPDKRLQRVCRRTGTSGCKRDCNNINFERLSQSNREGTTWGWWKRDDFLKSGVCVIAPLHRSDGRGQDGGAMQDFMCRHMCHCGPPAEGTRAAPVLPTRSPCSGNFPGVWMRPCSCWPSHPRHGCIQPHQLMYAHFPAHLSSIICPPGAGERRNN